MRLNHRRRSRTKESGSFWLSFSDMMSVLVLVFIFVIFGMMAKLAERERDVASLADEYESINQQLRRDVEELKSNNDELTVMLGDNQLAVTNLEEQLSDAKGEILLLTGTIDNQEETIVLLGKENSELKTSAEEAEEAITKYNELSRHVIMLENTEESLNTRINELLAQINTQRDTITSLESENGAIQNQLKSAINASTDKDKQIDLYKQTLEDYGDELLRMQGELQALVGVRADIVNALSMKFAENNVSVSVDGQTGAIALPSEMLFGSGEDTLTDNGRMFLDTFLPLYMDVLLSDDFSGYIAEIIIEGHTDSTGGRGDGYLFNLDLSQKRALSVSNYIMTENYMLNNLRLGASEIVKLRSLITASGRSYSARILNADGTENKDASRRVEIKFRLKDEQTIAATEAFLRFMDGNQ